MEYSAASHKIPGGGHFLLNKAHPGQTIIPGDYTEEHRMIKSSVDAFIEERIFPLAERIERQEDGLNKSLMEEAGSLGFLSAHIPDRYEGMQLDFLSETLIAEGMGGSGSFSVSYNAHTGIGMLPLLYYGTEAQKKKYLPLLGSGEWVAAYCLTEPGSGSDALSAKTRADLSVDGKHYIINGQKMWITNAGFADLFIVFAQLDGDKFTGFLVESGTPGMSLGEEEKKLGIKGSSTRQVFFEDARIPVENLLGEIGKGHLIAFNVLNIGRYKLGVSCLGGCKRILGLSASYANERRQFGKSISDFGAIKRKLGEQMIQTFVLESAILRTAALMEADIASRHAQGVSYGQAKLESAEEYALECSIIKIAGSEALDFLVDECVQIHGGMGYSEEGPVARAYRDSRINRIFEGTNEINRLLMVKMLFKKAMNGTFDIATKAMSVQNELAGTAPETAMEDAENEYPTERHAVESFKKLLVVFLGYAGQKAMAGKLDLQEAQEPVMDLSDIITLIYNCESLLLRVEKEPNSEGIPEAIMQVYFYEAAQTIYKKSLDIMAALAEEEMIPALKEAIRKLSRYPMKNTMVLKRQIAAEVSQINGFPG